jgi:hypothetical protein
MLRIVLMCQLYHVELLLLFNSFCCCLTFIQFFCLILLLFIVHCSLLKEKDSILILDCIPGILIPLYVKYLFIIIYASQINIIHQTVPSLS